MDWIGKVKVRLSAILSDNDDRISEDELEKLTQKHMVETPEQGDMGVKHGAFSNDGYICLQDNTYRICAPLPSDTHEMTSCIFWTKLSSTDNLPTWEKVVSGLLLLFMLYVIKINVVWISCLQYRTA